jgi:hypothetical protein
VNPVTKARLIYLLVMASTVAYVLGAMRPLGMGDGGGFL